MTYGVYCIEHTESGRRYIGKSKNIERRIKDHRSTANAAAEAWAKTFLAAALRKYGWEAFRWWIVEEVEPNDVLLAERELFWIDAYGVFGRGFNTKRESAGVTEFSQSVKDKIAASLRGRPLPEKMVAWQKAHKIGELNPFHGRQHTEATLAKLQKITADRWKDPEYQERMKLRKRGKSTKGVKASPETRAKMSAAKKGKPPPNKGTTYMGEALERMRLGYIKRSVIQVARNLKGLDTVDFLI